MAKNLRHRPEDRRAAEAGRVGVAIISRLARELHHELPEETGYSQRNIKPILAFYRAYRESPSIVPPPVAQLAVETKAPPLKAPLQNLLPERSVRQIGQRSADQLPWSSIVVDEFALLAASANAHRQKMGMRP